MRFHQQTTINHVRKKRKLAKTIGTISPAQNWKGQIGLIDHWSYHQGLIG
jgi:hypothetical protein